jgi:tetratricopeptide (TPR) repeat protein
MAEKAALAFGRYLRTLRERGSLSLDTVESLTRRNAEPVSKAYLSRVERGSGLASIGRLVALWRLYGVPLEVLAERLELDLELDRRGGPDTRGMTYEQLHLAGLGAFSQGFLWPSYAYFRDGASRAEADPLLPWISSRQEQRLSAAIHWTNIAAELGKSLLALWELDAVAEQEQLSGSWAVRLDEARAMRSAELGLFDRAHRHASAAADRAEVSGDPLLLAAAWSALGRIAFAQQRYVEAQAHFERADRACRAATRPDIRCHVLLDIARAFFAAGEVDRATRCAISARRLARRFRKQRIETSLILLFGDLQEARGYPDKAATLWRQALDRWRRVRDRINQFRAEFRLYQQAVARGEASLAGTFERRLSRLEFWIPHTIPEVASFRELARSRLQAPGRAVAEWPRPASLSGTTTLGMFPGT